MVSSNANERQRELLKREQEDKDNKRRERETNNRHDPNTETRQRRAIERQMQNQRIADDRVKIAEIKERGRTQRSLIRAQSKNARMAHGAPTTAGTILASAIGCVILIALLVTCGPLIDYFAGWVMSQPGNPYAAPVAEMFPWIYIFIFMSFIVYQVVVWRKVIQAIQFGVFD